MFQIPSDYIVIPSDSPVSARVKRGVGTEFKEAIGGSIKEGATGAGQGVKSGVGGSAEGMGSGVGKGAQGMGSGIGKTYSGGGK